VNQESALKALSNLKNFEKGSKFKQMICDFIANKLLSNEEKEEINKVFSAIDVNGDGTLQKDELKEGLEKYFNRKMSDKEIDEIFGKVDVDGSGEIGYSEFVVATMNDNNMISNEKLRNAYKLFDLDSGGTISFEEMKKII
jgi:calcium-dependent protein kinase